MSKTQQAGKRFPVQFALQCTPILFGAHLPEFSARSKGVIYNTLIFLPMDLLCAA